MHVVIQPGISHDNEAYAKCRRLKVSAQLHLLSRFSRLIYENCNVFLLCKQSGQHTAGVWNFKQFQF